MTTQQINEQQARFCPYGYMDVLVAYSLMEEYWIDWQYDLYDLCFDEAESLEWTWITIDKLDPVTVVYYHIYWQVKQDIENVMWIDIESMVWVHSNYSASSWDNNEQWTEWIKENKWKRDEANKDWVDGSLYYDLEDMTIYFLNQF